MWQALAMTIEIDLIVLLIWSGAAIIVLSIFHFLLLRAMKGTAGAYNAALDDAKTAINNHMYMIDMVAPGTEGPHTRDKRVTKEVTEQATAAVEKLRREV